MVFDSKSENKRDDNQGYIPLFWEPPHTNTLVCPHHFEYCQFYYYIWYNVGIPHDFPQVNHDVKHDYPHITIYIINTKSMVDGRYNELVTIVNGCFSLDL